MAPRKTDNLQESVKELEQTLKKAWEDLKPYRDKTPIFGQNSQ